MPDKGKCCYSLNDSTDKTRLGFELISVALVLLLATPVIADGDADTVQSAGSQQSSAGSSQVDESTERMVVTATKREQTLQEVPFSINSQTQADIQRTGAGSLEELSRNVAGLTIQNLGPGQSQVAIRGVSAGQIVRD